MGLLRKIRAAGLILMLAFLAAGCGRSDDNKPKEPSEADNQKPKANIPIAEKKKPADGRPVVKKPILPVVKPKPAVPDNRPAGDNPEDMYPPPVVDKPGVKANPPLVADNQPPVPNNPPVIDPKRPKLIDTKKPEPKEPPKEITEIEGKTIEKWILELNSKDPAKVEYAVGAIMSFPFEKSYKAVPILLKMLEDHRYEVPLDISLRVKIIPNVGNLLEGKLQQERSKLEKAKKEDLVQLTKEMERGVMKDVNRAIKVFTSKMLMDDQWFVRIQTLNALARFGPVARDSSGDILRNLKQDATWELRRASALALGPIAYDPKGPDQKIIDGLVFALLYDPCSQVRAAASQTIVALGPTEKGKAKLNLDLLNAAHEETEVPVQIGMYMALASIDGSSAQSGISNLIGFLKNKDTAISGQAMQSIVLLGAFFPSKNNFAAKAKLDKAVLDAAEKETDPKKQIPLLMYLVTPTPKPVSTPPAEPADSPTATAAIKLLANHLDDKDQDVAHPGRSGIRHRRRKGPARHAETDSGN